MFADQTTLWAAPFASGRARLTGERFRVVDTVLRAPSGASDTAQYAVSASGALVHLGVSVEDPATRTAGIGGGITPLNVPTELSLVWVDRAGNETPLDVRADQYSTLRISPDGTKVALVIGGNAIAGEERSVWVLDLETMDLSQITYDGQSDAPLWVGNERILFRTGPPPVGVYTVPIGGGEPQLLLRSTDYAVPFPMVVTPDARTLLVLHVDAADLAEQDILALSLEGNSEYVPLINDPGVQAYPTISPDGQFIAYHEGPAVTGTNIMVRPYPEVALRRYPVGTGFQPVFSRDGSEIFYFDGQSIVTVTVEYEPFDIGTPESFGLSGPYYYGANRSWDEGTDGRFLMTRTGTTAATGGLQVNVVLGFPEVLENRP